MHNGALCVLMKKHFHEAERMTQPRVDGQVVSMETALDAAAEALQKESSLLWRGSGDLGVMQGVTNLLMERIGGTLTRGGLCDEAGQAGIEAGRGYHRMLPLEQIAQAEVVVVWGRNLTVTNKHLLPFIEGKKLIVIDPVRTKIAKRADLFLQIKPRTDFYLALMLSRFAMMEDGQDTDWLEEHAPEWKDFYEFTQDFRIKNILRHIDVSLDTMGDMLHLIRNHRTVFLVGIGPQHYTIGDSVLWAIDSLAAVLGLFGREGCGVSYMGNSRQGYADPFAVSCKQVSMVATPFERFETVLVQGGNPAASMPESNRVEASLREVENLIYFGLHENETSALARIVIPAKSFLEKEDLRTSYGHHYVESMHQVIEGESGISEYDFAQAMLARLGAEALESEAYYLSMWQDQCDEVAGQMRSPDFQAVPYAEGFGEAGGDVFVFTDEFDDDVEPQALRAFRKTMEEVFDGHYWLLTPKARHTLNTQFEGKEVVHVPPEAGLKDGGRIRVVSDKGELELTVRIDEDLRHDCVMIPIGTPGVNRLTSAVLSNEGEGACYGEAKVTLLPLV
jgi:anaerobic selenocysteine-containing dehydrogenase